MLQTLVNNKQIILIRDKYTTIQGTEYYCSKIYNSNTIGFSNDQFTNNLQDQDNNDIFALEPIEKGLENNFEIGGIKEGIYEIKRDKTGKFKYFKLINNELLSNRENPNSIEIHPLNKLSETKGCIGLGINFDCEYIYDSEDILIKNSKQTCNYLLDSVFGNPNKNENQIVGTLEITTFQKYLNKILNDFFK